MTPRVEAIGLRAADAAADRLAEALRREVRGVTVTRVPGGIEITGRGLERRLAEEPALRWPGSLR